MADEITTNQSDEVLVTDVDLVGKAKSVRAVLRNMDKTAQQLRSQVIQLGVHLLEVRDAVGYGNYLKWLRDTVNKSGLVLSESKSLKAMQVAGVFKSVTLTDSCLSITAMYALAAPSCSPELREYFVGLSRNTDDLSAEFIVTTIKEYKQGLPKALADTGWSIKVTPKGFVSVHMFAPEGDIPAADTVAQAVRNAESFASSRLFMIASSAGAASNGHTDELLPLHDSSDSDSDTAFDSLAESSGESPFAPQFDALVSLLESFGWLYLRESERPGSFWFQCNYTGHQCEMSIIEIQGECRMYSHALEKYPLPAGMRFVRCWRPGDNPSSKWLALCSDGSVERPTAEFPGPSGVYEAALRLVKPVDFYPKDNQPDTPVELIDSYSLYILHMALCRLASDVFGMLPADLQHDPPVLNASDDQHVALLVQALYERAVYTLESPDV